MKTFVIHLERATARKGQVDHILAHTPDAEILPASDGAAMSDAARAAIYPGPAQFWPAYPFELSPGEIGCFESHKAAWQQMVEDDVPSALIVEDDVHIDAAAFDAALTLAKQHSDDWGYIQFQVRDIKGPCEELARDGNVALVRPEIIPLRTSAQLVSLAAAKALLAVSGQIDRPVDAFLQMRWHTGVDVACMVPSGVSDRTAETGGSTLSQKRGIWQELKVSVPRLLYRRRIKALSRR